MQLIDSKTYSMLFMCKYEKKDSSEDIWDRYLNLKDEKLDFAEMQVKLSSIKKELNNYIYNINAFKFKNELPFKKVNELYIVRDGSEYFDNLTDDNGLTVSSALNVDKFCNYSSLFI